MWRWGGLAIVTALLIGAAVGVGAFTFGYAKGYSYLTNDPGACANCHIMDEHYGAWLKSSHHTVATCNDCHTPHDFVGKWTVKAKNGFWHSFYFTTGTFHEPIQITPYSRRIAESACRDCHQAISSSLVHGELVPEFTAAGALEPVEAISCTRCHTAVGHWTR